MKRRTIFLCAGMGLAALFIAAMLQRLVHNRMAIVYNPTDSVARGWYWIGRFDRVTPLRENSIVLARLPIDTRAFADQRGYLPGETPILKRVGAVAPQSVCVQGTIVRIDRVAVATLRMHDGQGRPLQSWSQCRPLVAGEVFLLSDTNPASFDSRYFGPLTMSSVVGIAQPLWTWSSP